MHIIMYTFILLVAVFEGRMGSGETALYDSVSHYFLGSCLAQMFASREVATPSKPNYCCL